MCKRAMPPRVSVSLTVCTRNGTLTRAIHSARNGTHTTLHTDHFIVATHVVHSQWCMRELLCSFALLRSGMGPHLSAATPGPFSLFRVAIVLDLEVDVEVGAQNLDQLGQWNRIEWRERRERRGINRDGHNRPSPVRACHLYCLHSQWWYTHSLSLSLSPYTRGHISVATTCALGLFCALAL